MSSQSATFSIATLDRAAGSLPHDESEPRRALRVELPLPVQVRGVDSAGDRFELHTTLDSLGTSGLYVRLARLLAPGASLRIVIRLSLSPASDVPATRLVLRGSVHRVDPQTAGEWGVTITFDRHRFLYPTS